jgi:nitrile hydratase
MPVYCVKFEPADIWGTMCEPNTYVYADLFETYLEDAGA